MPAAVVGGIIAAAGSATAAGIAAHASGSAADKAAQANAAALRFQREQAAQEQANWEATQKANYDQWAAREGRMSQLGQLVGLPKREIPAYVPTTAPAGGLATGAAPTPAPRSGGSIAPYMAAAGAMAAAPMVAKWITPASGMMTSPADTPSIYGSTYGGGFLPGAMPNGLGAPPLQIPQLTIADLIGSQQFTPPA